jgi:hypothetical protein
VQFCSLTPLETAFFSHFPQLPNQLPPLEIEVVNRGGGGGGGGVGVKCNSPFSR